MLCPVGAPENKVGGSSEGDGVEGTGEGTSDDPEEEGEGERSSLAEVATEGSKRSDGVVGGTEKEGLWSSGRR